MAFKNIEQAAETKYDGYQFIDYDGDSYRVTFPDDGGLSYITRVSDLDYCVNTIPIHAKDLPKMIKVLQAVYDKYAEDNSGF